MKMKMPPLNVFKDDFLTSKRVGEEITFTYPVTFHRPHLKVDEMKFDGFFNGLRSRGAMQTTWKAFYAGFEVSTVLCPFAKPGRKSLLTNEDKSLRITLRIRKAEPVRVGENHWVWLVTGEVERA